jgi:hypothetical protein
MSPFDLPGSLFLVFYLFCGAVALIGVAMLHNLAEPRDTTKVNLSDPYLIAICARAEMKRCGSRLSRSSIAGC